MEESPIYFTTEKAEAVFAGHGKRLLKRDLRKIKPLGMVAVCFAEGLLSPTTFRASRMRASAISVAEDELELHET